MYHHTWLTHCSFDLKKDEVLREDGGGLLFLIPPFKTKASVVSDALTFLCIYRRERERVCVCVCVCEREREKEREREREQTF
jgi:hypothetical protein